MLQKISNNQKDRETECVLQCVCVERESKRGVGGGRWGNTWKIASNTINAEPWSLKHSSSTQTHNPSFSLSLSLSLSLSFSLSLSLSVCLT